MCGQGPIVGNALLRRGRDASSTSRAEVGRRVAVGLTAVVLLLVAACSGDDGGQRDEPGYVDDGKSLSFVAGSEQEKIIDAIVKPWCTEHELNCSFALKGSVDQVLARKT
jgi:hypothetical protein